MIVSEKSKFNFNNSYSKNYNNIEIYDELVEDLEKEEPGSLGILESDLINEKKLNNNQLNIKSHHNNYNNNHNDSRKYIQLNKPDRKEYFTKTKNEYGEYRQTNKHYGEYNIKKTDTHKISTNNFGRNKNERNMYQVSKKCSIFVG